MEINIITSVLLLTALVAGYLLRNFVDVLGAKRRIQQSEKEANAILEKARHKGEMLKKDRILEAKEKFLRLKKEHEKEVSQRNKQIKESEEKIRNKESQINQQRDDLNRQKKQAQNEEQQYREKKEVFDARKEELDKLHARQVEQLEKISGLSADEAREQMMESLKGEVSNQSKTYIKTAMDEAKLTATKEARKIVIETLQRVGSEQTIENCISVFHIDNDEMKGRIIGREGRNIRALEAATGVEIIVDDTPESIILSSFDPVRRETARLSLYKLVKDGRIHPARIEEVVTKTSKQIDEEIIETGEQTCIDLNIHSLHPELVKMVGRMRYRSSYGQNLLQHSREVAKMCAVMATELGLDPKIAKRAGLLHDIGKVSPEDLEMPHALLGMKIAERYNEKPEILNAIGAHHDEIEMTSIISPLVQICDSISGARPGARREVFESYIERLKNLERIALSFDGVEKCYAIQAGRELRVITESEKISDAAAEQLSFDISQKIQEEMTYPGQIKVTVIRERRAVNYAK